MHFAGWSHLPEDYVAALAASGHAIAELREPRAAQGQWDRMPLFFWINAVHRP